MGKVLAALIGSRTAKRLPSGNRDSGIKFRCSVQEKEAWEAESARLGITTSEFILSRLNKSLEAN